MNYWREPIGQQSEMAGGFLLPRIGMHKEHESSVEVPSWGFRMLPVPVVIRTQKHQPLVENFMVRSTVLVTSV
jgi:hypothetical protein